MNNKDIVVHIGTDDIYFIIDKKETSVLKMIENLNSKISKIALGAWVALGLTIVIGLPIGYFQLSLAETREQTNKLKEQDVQLEEQDVQLEEQLKKMQLLSDRILILEQELKHLR